MVIRKQYSKEFKLDAISLVLDQGYTIAEAARSLEIRANMLGSWLPLLSKATQRSIAKNSFLLLKS
jgi:transposase-like protein